MDLMAPLSRHLIAPAHAAWKGQSQLRHLRRLLRTQHDSTEVVAARQAKTLRSLARHAIATAPFWRDRFADVQLAADDIQVVDDLRRLPILAKADIRGAGETMLSSAYSRAELHEHRTSGSTGVSVVTYRDEACQQFKRAATLRSDEWSGWRRGERIACVWGNPDYPRGLKARLHNTLLCRNVAWLDTLKMDDSNLHAFVDELSRWRPSLLFGHAHSLYLLATFVHAQRAAERIRPKGIIATCMVLHDFERERIEDVFGCKVTNRYGCEEVSLIACECEQHAGLHVNSDCVLVELIDRNGGACQPGESGRVIVTDLTNRAMPIFRYEVGDMATWAPSKCSCGRSLPLLEKIEGRVADYVVTPRGEYVSGISLTENFALRVPGVAQMQIVQEQIDFFIYNIVRNGEFGADSLEQIAALTRERFGDEVRHECRFVDKVLPEPSGKYRFCISKVEKAFC